MYLRGSHLFILQRESMANPKSLTLEKLMVALRDGRKLIGVLRSWDQFGTFTLLISFPL